MNHEGSSSGHPVEEVVDHLLAGLHERLEDALAATWQGYLQNLAHAVRRIALEHPSAFPLVAAPPPAAPWLRPPLRSLELVESFLSTLLGHGFTDQQAADTYRVFTGFLLGHLLLETSVPRPRAGAGGPLAGDGGTPDVAEDDHALGGSPAVLRLRGRLSQDRSLEEFETGLESLLDRLEMHLSQ